MIVGGWLEISKMSGVAGATQVSIHTLSKNDTDEDRSVTLNFKTPAAEITRASLTITQTSKNIVIITREDTVISREETVKGYGY